MRAWSVPLALAALAGGLHLPTAWGCGPPMPREVVGVVRAVVQEPATDRSPWTPDLPGAILELQSPAGILQFRLSRNIGMTLTDLRARARDGRPVRVQYETDYDGKLRALDISPVEKGK